MNVFGSFLSTLLLLIPFSVQASDVMNTLIENTPIKNTSENTTITSHAEDWQLTTDEWLHYQQLMQGQSGHWYLQLTPPEVLGIYAKTAQEQQHFAELVALQEHDRVAREVVFDHVVYQALNRLYPNEPLINTFDYSSFNPVKNKIQEPRVNVQSGDHLILFADIAMSLDFITLPHLMSVIKNNPGVVLDIYCVNSIDDAAIRQWAKLNAIPMELVQSGRITLNPDQGQLQKMLGKTVLPVLLLVRHHQSQLVSVNTL